MNIIKYFNYYVSTIPTDMAVVCGKRQTTFSELDKLSNQIANYVFQVLPQPNDVMGILLDKSIETITAILALQKLNRTFLLLDSSETDVIINQNLLQIGISHVITKQPYMRKLDSSISSIDINFIDEISNTTTPDFDQQPSNELCYICYTSGSSGNMKAVQVSHKNLESIYLEWIKVFNLQPRSTPQLQMASCQFDVFIGDLMRSIFTGNTLVLCDKPALLHPESLYELLKTNQIKLAEFVPVILRRLVKYLQKSQNNLEFMNTLICGSDKWTVAEYKLFKQFLRRDAKLYNTYGITECTIDNAYFTTQNIDSLKVADSDIVPIGIPFNNSKIFILNPKGLVAEPNEQGELYITGECLSYGYVNPETIKSNPFVTLTINGKEYHCYKTGDMGYIDIHGNIRLLGRIDQQVKLNGIRIELTTIEAAINSYPGVKECYVECSQKKMGLNILVAYIIPNPDMVIDNNLLNQYLKTKLPYFMLPKYFKHINKLPTTLSGKIKHKNTTDLI